MGRYIHYCIFEDGDERPEYWLSWTWSSADGGNNAWGGPDPCDDISAGYRLKEFMDIFCEYINQYLQDADDNRYIYENTTKVFSEIISQMTRTSTVYLRYD